MLYSSEKNSHCAKQVLLPNILLQLPTVHYGCYSQDSLRCELYTVSTTLLFFAICHLAIIMKSDHHKKSHHQQQPLISQLYTICVKECRVAKLVMQNAILSWNCTTSNEKEFLLVGMCPNNSFQTLC